MWVYNNHWRHFPSYTLITASFREQANEFITHSVGYVFPSEPHTGAYSLVQAILHSKEIEAFTDDSKICDALRDLVPFVQF